MRATDPIVTFLLVLVIGIAAGILFDQLAGGPATGGLYRVRIADAKLDMGELDRRIRALQADTTVDFIATTQ